MNITELLRGRGMWDSSSFVPLSEVKTQEDKKALEEQGYLPGYTVSEWEQTYDIPAQYIYYDNGNFAPETYYYDPDNAAVPIVLRLMLFGRNLIHPKGNDIDAYCKSIKQTAESLRGNPTPNTVFSYLVSLDNSMRIKALCHYVAYSQPSAELYTRFKDLYLGTDYGFSHIDIDVMKKVVGGKTEAQKRETQARLQSLPDTVTVYRGQSGASTPLDKTFSWTPDINTAYFFACRLDTSNASIVSAQVKKENIIEVFEDSEPEYWIFPEHIIEPETLELISPSGDEVSPFRYIEEYWEYRDIICGLYEDEDSECHDALHSARVLFLALAIVQAGNIELTAQELESLCRACAWHDVGRTNDCVDPSHGKKSKNIFVKEYPNDKVAAFAITYHSIDDETAEQDLYLYGKMTASQKKSAKLIYTILKDADALDRVRFGLRDLDVNFLRLDISKRMVAVAQAALHSIKIN